MKAIRYGLCVLTAAALAASIAAANEEKEQRGGSGTAGAGDQIFEAEKIVWGDPPPRLPPGCKAAVLFGDPTKPGWFTVRLQAPAGYKIPLHTHATAEHVTVISGSIHLGDVDERGEKAGRVIGAGGYVILAAGTKHSAWFTEDAVIQIQAEGPFDMEYVNPADDPRAARK